MKELIAKYVRNGFVDFRGSFVSGEIVLTQALINDVLGEFLERPQPAVGLHEPDQVAARPDRDVAQRYLGGVPLGQGVQPRQREQPP